MFLYLDQSIILKQEFQIQLFTDASGVFLQFHEKIFLKTKKNNKITNKGSYKFSQVYENAEDSINVKQLLLYYPSL